MFTSHVSGDHSICLRSNYTGGWVRTSLSIGLPRPINWLTSTPSCALPVLDASGPDASGHCVRLASVILKHAWHLIHAAISVHSVGEAKVDEDTEKSHVSDLASKVRELNKRLEDIRKEQQFQREREHDFRNISDKANSGAVWWSVLQISVLLGTCAWQLRSLRVSKSLGLSKFDCACCTDDGFLL